MLDSTAEGCAVQDIGNTQKLNKRKKVKQGKLLEANGACNDNSSKLDSLIKNEQIMDKTVQDLPRRNGCSQEQANHKWVILSLSYSY